MATGQPTPQPNHTLAYLRVSTEDQNLGLVAQHNAIQAFCVSRGLTLTACYIDHGVSGATLPADRPGLSACLASLPKHGVLVAAKRDRLARDTLAVALLERTVRRIGARILTADGSSDHDIVAGVLDVFAKHERQVIRDRTRAALSALRAQGRPAGHAPYGYRVEPDATGQTRGVLVTDSYERSILDTIASLRASGHGYRAIATELGRLGLRTRSGTPWTWDRVRKIVKER